MVTGKVGFIGAGQMATALARGFVAARLVKGDAIVASDPSPTARERFVQAVPGAMTSESNWQLARSAEVLFLAVKPQQMDAVLADLGKVVDSQVLVVSIAAGVTLARLSGSLPPGSRIARVMPNTPCLIGRGAIAFSLNATSSEADSQIISQLLAAVGTPHKVPEVWLDAVTGLSGSGPAFVYTVIEALAEGGVAMGLPAELALALAAQTTAGAAEMVLFTGESPDELRRRVMSPSGTTVAGMRILEEQHMAAALREAVRAATLRSQELGEQP